MTALFVSSPLTNCPDFFQVNRLLVIDERFIGQKAGKSRAKISVIKISPPTPSSLVQASKVRK